MGVPAELLGKQVRCPHCKQVVLAPVSAAPSGVVPALNLPPPPPPIQPAPVPPPPPPEPEIPTFAVQRKEGADSILSEPDESEDEVFGSQPGARLGTVPPLDLTNPTAPMPPPRQTPVDDSPFEIAGTTAATGPIPPAPRPASPSAPTQGPTAELPNPVLELEPVTLPAVFAAPGSKPAAPAPAPAPVRPVYTAPAPFPAPVPAPAPVGGNPFVGFDDTGPRPAPVPVPVPVPAPAPEATEELDEPRHKKKKREDDAQPEEKSARRTRAAAPAPGGANNVALFVVIGYAVLVTGLAVYGLFFKSGEKFDTGHPLSTIPDNFGEYDPATRKKVSQYKFPVDGELPAQQRASLGEKITLGQLEIQPMRIDRRPLVIETETAREKKSEATKTDALVLTMSIKNTSDLTFHPMDPAFTRKANVGKNDYPITRIVVDKKTFFAGGFLDWPIDYNRVKKRIEKQQANDAIPLKPNETRQYVVFTDARSEILSAVAKAKDALQWRVEVRRGPVEVDGKEIPVTAIIGVEFRSTDVKILDLPRAP